MSLLYSIALPLSEVQPQATLPFCHLSPVTALIKTLLPTSQAVVEFGMKKKKLSKSCVMQTYRERLR